MNSTAIAIAISIVVGGAAGSAATAVAISFSSTPATCPVAAAKDNATQQFFTPAAPLPTTGYATYGAKDYP